MHHTTYRDTKTQRTARYFDRMAKLGLSYSEADTLRLAELRLQRWGELECGRSDEHASWGVERDETTDLPYLVTHYNSGRVSRRRVADREKGALRRVAAILAEHPGLWYYHQGDPRGCALYVGLESDIPPGQSIAAFYARGVACCI